MAAASYEESSYSERTFGGILLTPNVPYQGILLTSKGVLKGIFLTSGKGLKEFLIKSTSFSINW